MGSLIIKGQTYKLPYSCTVRRLTNCSVNRFCEYLELFSICKIALVHSFLTRFKRNEYPFKGATYVSASLMKIEIL